MSAGRFPHLNWSNRSMLLRRRVLRLLTLRLQTLRLLTILLMTLLGCHASKPLTPEQQLQAELRAWEKTQQALAEQCGIRVEGLYRTSAGYMLDLRYTVLDSVKAAPLWDKSVKPYLEDPKTGHVFVVPSPPKLGPLRQRPHEVETQGRTLFALFANPGHYFKSGDRAHIHFGPCYIPLVTVR